MYEVGKRYLITTNDWFIAPDGEQYKSAFGVVNSVSCAKETLGVQTNRNSTNWYVSIGNMVIAGCQIHYVIQTDDVSLSPSTTEVANKDGQMVSSKVLSRIYVA